MNKIQRIAPFTFGLEFVKTWKIILRIIALSTLTYLVASDAPARANWSMLFYWILCQVFLVGLLGWHLGEFLWRLKNTVKKSVDQ